MPRKQKVCPNIRQSQSMFLLVIVLIISDNNINKTVPGHHSVNIYQVL
jgi:hypothetical protein